MYESSIYNSLYQDWASIFGERIDLLKITFLIPFWDLNIEKRIGRSQSGIEIQIKKLITPSWSGLKFRKINYLIPRIEI